MKKLIRKLIPGFIKRWRSEYLKNKYLRMLSRNKQEVVFEKIYRKNLWGDPESLSGGGSNLQQTAEISRLIPLLLKKYNVRSVLDLPCGDFNWMRNLDLSQINYIGGDIVKDLIKKNQAGYTKSNIHFKVIDIMNDQLPAVDLILCRDCFIHFSTKDILKSLENIKRSKARYLLTTSFIDRTSNTDILTGEWRGLNLTIPPFDVNPLETINEKCSEGGGIYKDKSLILIDVAALRSANAQ
jgi:SAM-dependent methyltransferase